MKILIIPDSFKGSASNVVVAESIEKGILQSLPSAQCVKIPFADGGEGSLEAIETALGGSRVTLQTLDPLGRSIEAFYLRKQEVSYLELAQASGLQLVSDDEKNAGKTTTRGSGILLKHACQEAGEVIFCIGGSATNDAACGIAAAMGYQFLDAQGKSFMPVGDTLSNIDKIISPDVLPKARLKVLCDVNNPLTGAYGATYVYGKQKGANQDDLRRLEAGMEHFRNKIIQWKNVDLNSIAGAGAAGGVGGGLVAFFDAALVSGTQYLMDQLEVEKQVQDCDLIFTGEGKIDSQTGQGKLISGLTALARKHAKPVIVLCGVRDISMEEMDGIGLTAAFTILAQIESEVDIFEKTPLLIQQTAAQIMRVVQAGL
ncbi:MAG: glycerate kinase [Saprospiraceae bacterium]|nr:glycerate kinase [Saprospiraceae bacterium]